MNNVTGASGAAPIWKSVMERYHEGLPYRWYERPRNVVAETVCQPSGLQPSPDCQRQRVELFIAGTEPKVVDNLWQPSILTSAMDFSPGPRRRKRSGKPRSISSCRLKPKIG